MHTEKNVLSIDCSFLCSENTRLVHKAKRIKRRSHQFKTESKFTNNHLAKLLKNKKTNAYNMKTLSTSNIQKILKTSNLILQHKIWHHCVRFLNCSHVTLPGLPDWPFCDQISDIWPHFKLVGRTIF